MFAERSAWAEWRAAAKQWLLGAAVWLRPWSTSIQEVEGRHGVLLCKPTAVQRVLP